MVGEGQAGKTPGPLHGVSILFKGNMAAEVSMHTTADSWALLGSTVSKDAFIVARLRAAGAIILGHANMSDAQSLRANVFSTGYSRRGGQVRNPYDLRKSPYGSSSGSAVAVSANLVPVSVGTETDTCIIGPAGANGLIGIKPTAGLTSCWLLPISTNMDTVGPFGRTVADAVAVLDATAAPDAEDHFTTVPDRKQASAFLSRVSKWDVLHGARYRLPKKGCWDLAGRMQSRSNKCFAALTRAGAAIIEVDLPTIEEHGTQMAVGTGSTVSLQSPSGPEQRLMHQRLSR